MKEKSNLYTQLPILDILKYNIYKKRKIIRIKMSKFLNCTLKDTTLRVHGKHAALRQAMTTKCPFLVWINRVLETC